MGDSTSTPRARQVSALHDFSTGHGLEIGPLDQPLVSRATADVSYADLYDRAGLHEANRNHPQVTLETIPEIDYVLWDGSRVRTLPEAVSAGAPFDWAVASHVAEHVPDLVGWLQQLEAVVAPDGVLVLVVPDRRYTFDAHRPPTTMGQVLQAYDAGDTVPSVRAVYDHHRSVVLADEQKLHHSGPSEAETCLHDLDFTRTQLERARDGEYVDCHVWTWTDRSFAELLAELRRLELTDWSVESLVPTSEHDSEFYVLLRRGLSPDLPPQPGLPDWVGDGLDLRTEVEELRAKVADQRDRLRSQRERMDRLRSEADALRGSRRFRVGSLIAAPLDAWRNRRS